MIYDNDGQYLHLFILQLVDGRSELRLISLGGVIEVVPLTGKVAFVASGLRGARQPDHGEVGPSNLVGQAVHNGPPVTFVRFPRKALEIMLDGRGMAESALTRTRSGLRGGYSGRGGLLVRIVGCGLGALLRMTSFGGSVGNGTG